MDVLSLSRPIKRGFSLKTAFFCQAKLIYSEYLSKKTYDLFQVLPVISL